MLHKSNIIHFDMILTKVHSRKETVDGDVFHAASRLNCGLFMPSGPSDTKDSEFLQETYKQLLDRKDVLDMQHTGVLEVATNKEEFEFGKSLFEKANTEQQENWLQLMTKEEIKAEEPNLETVGGLLFTQAKDEIQTYDRIYESFHMTDMI